MKQKMLAAYLPGNSTVLLKNEDIPEPGYGQVLLKMKASTICGSDIRAIYREHLGKGPERYQNVICGHEPAGQIISCGTGLKRFQKGDRVLVYHISGCGLCYDCRRGYQISCSSKHRAAYGWQRDGGMAEYIVTEEKDLIALPDRLSYADGAQIACGFGTAYEGLEKIGISGNDAVLVVGLGPVGLATLMLAKAMGANQLIGVDIVAERLALAKEKNIVDVVLETGPDTLVQLHKLTNGYGVERAIDCSGNDKGRELAIQATRKWGKIAFIGEGGSVSFRPSPDIIHDQKTIYGSWVTSLWKMEDLVEKVERWAIQPANLITHKFPLSKASEAYALMAEGKCGKVAILAEEELL